MSWNIKTPGEYINGPLTVNGSATITGDLTVDTNTLKVDSLNNTVGIGNSSPPTGTTNTDIGLALGSAGTVRSVLIGMQNCFGRIRERDAINNLAITTNIGATGTIDDNTRTSWKVRLGSGNDNFSIQRAAIGSSTFVEYLQVNADGNLGLGVTPSAGGGVLQLKSGITFPATQVASSDANTLDDYEESTWSPTITAGSGTPTTVTINSASYTKIGRVVIAQVDFTIVNKGTATTSLLFTLPFTSASLNQCGAFRETTNTGNMGQIYSNGTTQAAMQFYGNTTVWADTNRIAGTFTYFAA